MSQTEQNPAETIETAATGETAPITETAAISETGEQVSEKLTNNKDIIAYIAELFPNCFTLTGDAKPLKIGVFQELAERLTGDAKVSKTQLRGAIRQYTTSWRYLHCIKEGAERVDLDGNSAGVLEAEHVEHAQKTLAESKAKVQARRKEQAAKKRQEQAEQAKKTAPKRPANSSKSTSSATKKTTKATPQSAPAKPADTRVLTSDEIVVGKNVHVNMGQGNMPATIVEVNKNDVRVRLANGLQMGVKAENLHL